MIVSPEEAASSLVGSRVLDARSGPAGRAAYGERHVKGALHADLDRDLAGPAERPERGGRHPLPSLARWSRTLGGWGIAPDTPVLVYDDQGAANAAARAWWMLRAVGHRRVAVVDGGFDALVEAGVPLEAGAPEGPAADPYPLPPAWLLPTVDAETVASRLREGDVTVLDVRATERFRGDSEPIDPVAGHIPGARNLPYAENLDAGGRFKSRERLGALYGALLADGSADRLIVHCGSGVTACHTLLALEHAGLPGAALYVGSFGEWCRQNRPIARGA